MSLQEINEKNKLFYFDYLFECWMWGYLTGKEVDRLYAQYIKNLKGVNTNA